MRKISFKDTQNNTELVLPVTPPSFEVSHGINIETVNIHMLGEVALAGYGTLPTFKIDCMLPARKYPFNQPETVLNPYKYVTKIEEWCDNHTVLRFIVSDTMVNAPVLISEIIYGERDGTGDVYATISMHKYREVQTVQLSVTGNNSRTVETALVIAETYVIDAGDTLSAICRRFYGDASLYDRLARYNNISNPNLIYAGNVLKIPDIGLL